MNFFMSFAKFEHKSYGQMTITPECWAKCKLFDAANERGNTMPVYKSDCEKTKYVKE